MLKKFLAFVAVIIIIYSVYIDINFGTIPAVSQVTVKSEKNVTIEKPAPYVNKKVIPGDTVLSIVEKINKSPLSIPIKQVIIDFKKFNHNITPEEIQIGQVYKFPIYK
ncbi:hypothetical protein I5776_08135 [Heyndrickxia vini]|uniref:LysM domain-containing protein n=1 Tax=Heyndrickxia vini TaxID=1476025 RepID=A0ABX7E867_9BACI|nr:hypothetical protein I5776_08135 [Heyndrickxia vini]